MLVRYEIPMIARRAHSRSLPRTAMAMAVLVAGIGLSGCADLGDGFASGAFVDPAKYQYYDCKLLEAERKTLATRSAELQGLMAKANTGVAGPVVAELAYRNDYISVRAQAKLADEAWRQDRCHDSPPAAATATPAPAAHPKGRRSPQRSGNAVYLTEPADAFTVASRGSNPVAPAAAFRRSP
jgi:hypothetical protein